MKQRLSILLALCLVLSVLPGTAFAATAGLGNFKKTRDYPGFSDVSAGQWYADDVRQAYELGFVNGTDTGTFNPANPISIAETLVLACRIHNIYYGSTGQFAQGNPWYQVYVDYAIANGIISSGSFSDYTAPANRQTFALIIANALPEDALPAINSISAEAIPDSGSISTSFLPAVLRLYNAGIVTGSDTQGTFNPTSNIQRSEVATIATRIAVSSKRKSFSLMISPAQPTMPAQSAIPYYAERPTVPDFGAMSGVVPVIRSDGNDLFPENATYAYDLDQCDLALEHDPELLTHYVEALEVSGFTRASGSVESDLAMLAYYTGHGLMVAIGVIFDREGDFFVVVVFPDT